jgi:hypothetical protein
MHPGRSPGPPGVSMPQPGQSTRSGPLSARPSAARTTVAAFARTPARSNAQAGGQLANPSRTAQPTENPLQREFHLLSQPRRLAKARARASTRTRPGSPRPRPGRPGTPGKLLRTGARQRLHGTAGHIRSCANGGRPGNGSRPGLADVTAVAALSLSQPAHQVHAGTYRAPVKLGRPVNGRLARGADEHLAVGPDPSFPGALPPVRVDLPCTTAIAGHSVFRFCRSPRMRPDGLVELRQRLLILGDVTGLRYGIDDLPPHHAILINDEGPARGNPRVLVEHAVLLRQRAVRPEV